MRKSFDRIAASIAPFAAAINANSERALVRALSTSSGLWVRAPTADATRPYTASARPASSAKAPRRSIGHLARRERRRGLSGERRRVRVVVLDQDRIRVEHAVAAVVALDDDAGSLPEQRRDPAGHDHRHPGGAVREQEPDP